MILVGWGITIATILGSALVAFVPTNYFTRIPKNPIRRRIKDYSVGIICSLAVCMLTALIFRTVVGAVASESEVEGSIQQLVILAPFFGWMFTFAMRSKNWSAWSPPDSHHS